MLTDTQCRTARPKEKLYRLNDFNGLYLEVKPNGKKAWRYRFKTQRKIKHVCVG
ncbi:Arm DNA-binding domain-containing protein [Dickeya zeae]|uniref:Arm DNA-binding domain-containing protein n=1 Tax=Dickeya zeae TaxID=204042 RepID=UPI0039B069A8